MRDVNIEITENGTVTVSASVNPSNRAETLRFIEKIAPQIDKIQTAATERPDATN